MPASLDLDQLRVRLAQEPPPVPLPQAAAPPTGTAGDSPAAVLVALVPGPAGWYLVLTRRTSGLSTHRGEIAFPGGRVEPGETSREAACREAEEEVGIPAGQLEVLGALPPVRTRVSRFTITPWVAVLSDAGRRSIRPNPAEVAAIIEVPLPDLAAPSGRREQRFIRGSQLIVAPAFEVAGITIWGATARIVAELLAILK